MSRAKPFSRISITLPPEVLAAADHAAKELARSRSWVIAEALRHFHVLDISPHPVAGLRAAAVEEPGTVAAPTAATASPQEGDQASQLLADMKACPEERVRAAEEAARLDTITWPSHRARLLAFDHYEAYLAWDQRSRSHR